MNGSAPCIAGVIAAPLLAGLASPLKRVSRPVYYALALALSAFSIAVTVHTGIRAEPVAFGRFLFELDVYSCAYAVLVNVCWCLTLIYSAGYVPFHLRDQSERFYRYMGMAVALSLAGGLSGNFFSLLFFYGLSLPVIAPLISLRGDEESKAAARTYLAATIAPFVLVAIPVVALNFPLFASFGEYTVTSLGFSAAKAAGILALLIVGFSKNCVFPFHFWLPRSSVAPSPVTALVHSVGAVQMAVIALIKIGTHVYGTELLSALNDSFWGTGWLTFLLGGTALYTAYHAYRTLNLKRRFSYSTVGQLSYILTALLVGTRMSIQGAVLHMVTHSLAKMNLFFFAGICRSMVGTVEAPQVARWLPSRRWVGVAAVISGLSIAGFPFLAGYVSKETMLIEEVHRHHYAAAFFLLCGSAINFVYIYPLIRATFGRGAPAADLPASTRQPVPWTMALGLILTTALVLSLSHYVFLLMQYV